MNCLQHWVWQNGGFRIYPDLSSPNQLQPGTITLPNRNIRKFSIRHTQGPRRREDGMLIPPLRQALPVVRNMIITFWPYKCVLESHRTAYYLFTQIDAFDLKDWLVNTSGFDFIVSVRSSQPLLFRIENDKNPVPGLTIGRFNVVLWAALYDAQNGCRIKIEIVSGFFTMVLLGLLFSCCIISIFFAGFILSNMMVLG